MITKTKDFLSIEKLPKFIKNNKTLNSLEDIYKVFPDIGIPNCKEIVKIDNTAAIEAAAAGVVNFIINALTDFINNFNYYINKGEDVCAYKQVYLPAKYIKYSIEDAYNVSKNNLLKLQKDILIDGKVYFKQGQSLFKVYNQIRNYIKENNSYYFKLPEMESSYSFKNYSATNISSSNTEIVFSSNNTEGLWDIATMSQRGIQSCQSWNGSHKYDLVGSIIDPFTAIIYLTANNGNMIRRCIVRFIVNKESREKSILIDRMYPAYDEAVDKSFISFLEKRTNIPVISNASFCKNKDTAKLQNEFFIPTTKITENFKYLSYRDTVINYGRTWGVKYYHNGNIEKLIIKTLSIAPQYSYYYRSYDLLFNIFEKLILKEHPSISMEEFDRLICLYFLFDKNKLVSRRNKLTFSTIRKNSRLNINEIKDSISSINALIRRSFKDFLRDSISKTQQVSPLPN